MAQNEQLVPSVLVLDRHRQLLILNTQGVLNRCVTPSEISQISCSIEGTIWSLADRRGAANAQLYYTENNCESWRAVEVPELNISSISASPDGGCFIVTPSGSAYFIAKSGENQLVFNKEVAKAISISPEGYVWVLSRAKKEGGGNLIYWCSLNNFALQPVFGQPVAKRISAGKGGAARIVTIGGEIGSLYLNRIGGLETKGGVEFAREIAAGFNSNMIWATCPDSTQKRKRNVLKYWDPDKDEYLKWHAIPDVDPVKITSLN